MESDVMVEAAGAGKMYRLYDVQRDRLKQFVLPPLRRAFGLAERQYYKGFWALRNIDFTVRRGETVGIVGRNGSGKSTLLQLICGTLNLTEGSVSTNGRIAALLELGSGFNPLFTGRENVYVNAALLGFKRKEIESRLEPIAEFAGIGEFFDQPVRTYSSGMYVRLAFSVIAHLDADVLVIDEALAVGDAQFAQKCMRFLHEFKQRGTILFVSHDTNAVSSLCDKALFLDRGSLMSYGDTNDVLKEYLSFLHQEDQIVDGISRDDDVAPPTPEGPAGDYPEWRDMRADLIAASPYRNDLEVFTLPANSHNALDFGTGEAVMESVRLVDRGGVPYSWVVGGEDVVLEIRCLAKKDIGHLVMGFAFKNRLGQILFDDDTSLAVSGPVAVRNGMRATARFFFRLPVLSPGSYAVDAIVGELDSGAHIRHHWAHDALMLTAHTSGVQFGLMKVPMRDITLELENDPTPPPETEGQ